MVFVSHPTTMQNPRQRGIAQKVIRKEDVSGPLSSPEHLQWIPGVAWAGGRASEPVSRRAETLLKQVFWVVISGWALRGTRIARGGVLTPSKSSLWCECSLLAPGKW